MADGVKIEGLRELQYALNELGSRVARNSLRRAVSSGAAVIRDEARNLAPVDTGEMKRDIQIKRERNEKGVMSARYSVFVRSGKKSRLAGRGRNVNKDSFYWRFVEFGTAKMAAKPFMRPAFQMKKESAVQAIQDVLEQSIRTEAQGLKR